MAGDTPLTIIGNLTSDITLTFTPSGVAIANFTVASTSRVFNRTNGQWGDGNALFLRCSLFREQAENAAESLVKGTRIIVSGRLKQRSFQTREGEKRTVIELEVDELGPSLRWAQATVTRTPSRNSGSDNGFGQPVATTNSAADAPADRGSDSDPWAGPDPTGTDPWAVPAAAGAGAAGFGSEPPF
ncbi:single-stranded DNA-binding protein [Nocardia asteroides]